MRATREARIERAELEITRLEARIDEHLAQILQLRRKRQKQERRLQALRDGRRPPAPPKRSARVHDVVEDLQDVDVHARRLEQLQRARTTAAARGELTARRPQRRSRS